MRMDVHDPGARDYRVYLDGQELHGCTYADEENGMAVCYELSAEGRVIAENGWPKRKLVRGKIELRRERQVV